MSAVLLTAIVVAGLTHAPQEAVTFARTYAVGEKPVYTTTFATKLLGGHSISLDVQLTTSKILGPNKVVIIAHESNKRATGEGEDTTKIPEDLTFTLGENNMPEKFPMREDGSMFELFLFLAAATPNKSVKAGDDIPWSWSDGALAFSGSTKIIEISGDRKRLKALITQKMTLNGQEAGTFSLTSNYDLRDGKLLDSAGGVSMGGLTQDLKFVLKQ